MKESNYKPLVTIVTPVFNQENFIEETIESVLSQTYPYIEYIVIDDGSTDSSFTKISKYSDRVKVFKKNNTGQSDTLNYGWGMANGTYIGYISSDDCLKPKAIELLVNALIESDSGVVYCDYDLIDGESRYIRTVEVEPYDKKRLCIDLVCLPGPGALFEKKLFEGCGGWNSNFRQIPDYAFWVKLSAITTFKKIPISLALFRIHDDSASYRKMSINRINEIVDFVSKNDFSWVSDKERKIALHNANIKASRLSAQSGEITYLMKYYSNAFRLLPFRALSPSSIWFIAKGYLRRLYYNYIFNTVKTND